MQDKLKFSISFYLSQFTQNKIRLFLSIISVFIAGTILFTSYALLDSYYFHQFEKYSYYNEANLIEYKFDNQVDDETMSKLIDSLGSNLYIYKTEMTGSLKWPFMINETEIQLSFNITRVNNFDARLVLSSDYVVPSSLIKGRGITEEDILEKKDVIVIDEITEQLLFSGNGLGKEISIPIMGEQFQNGYSLYTIVDFATLEVVGVYENSFIDKFNFSEELEENDSLIYNTFFYIPISLNLVDSTFTDTTYLFYNIDDVEKSEAEAMQIIINRGVYQSLDDYNSYNSIVIELSETLSDVKQVIIIIVGIILMIASAIIVEAMIFSIKERFVEIGIKQAVGAKKSNILIEIFLEGSMYGLISFLLSFLISILVCLILLNIVSFRDVSFTIPLIIKGKTVLLCFVVIQLVCIVSSIIPAYIASKMKIVDSLKFE